jgi:pyruvate dehydrogenase E2 component (dihydrolipoamide acetyltransferase)
MAVEVIMPRLTHDMQAGIFVRWLVKAGQSVKRGELLFEVETDKAVAEVAAEADGVLRAVCVQEGDRVPIGETIAYLAGADEELPDPCEQQDRPTLPKDSSARGENQFYKAAVGAEERPRINATPIARRMAREKGIDLNLLEGSGPHGRIIEANVRAYEARLKERRTSEGMKKPLGEDVCQMVPLTKIERATGKRMLESVRTIPQFTLEVDVDMGEARRWRECYNQESKTKVSYTALLVRTVAAVLKRQPRMNARLDGERIVGYREVNLGVAVATPQGLIVPVIRKADGLNVEQIQEVLEVLQEQAQVGKLPAERLSGATFTLSNLGMFGIDRFQAIINPPEAAILAAGRIRERPWVVKGEISARPIMTLRLTVDHRVADGATAAPFLVEVDRLMKNPYLLL